MPIFGPSPLEQEIEKATQESVHKEDVPAMYDICDRVNATQDGAKEAYRCLVKRLWSTNPRVSILALSLLDVCVINCGKKFHLEICSRDFTTLCKTILTKGHPKVQEKLKFLLCKWAANEFKADPQLAIIDNFIQKSKMEGVSFDVQEPTLETMESKPQPRNTHHQKQEDDDLAKAIELSLQESNKKDDGAVSGGDSGLYPSMSKVASLTSSTTAGTGSGASNSSSSKAKESRKVRALYDFEAAEENELSFKAGEIIIVLEDRDPNWWKGSNHRGEGLFPSNFVTSDLEATPEELPVPSTSAVVEAPTVAPVTQVDEAKIDSLLQMLHDADPTALQRTETDSKLEALEAECALMNPLIDAELEKIDRKHASLSKLSRRLTDALSMYHYLLGQPQMQPHLAAQMMTLPGQGQVPPMPYYGPPMTLPLAAGYPGAPVMMAPPPQSMPSQVGHDVIRQQLHPGMQPPPMHQQMPPQQQQQQQPQQQQHHPGGPLTHMPVVAAPPYGYLHPAMNGTMNGTMNGVLPPDLNSTMAVPQSQVPPGQAQ